MFRHHAPLSPHFLHAPTSLSLSYSRPPLSLNGLVYCPLSGAQEQFSKGKDDKMEKWRRQDTSCCALCVRGLAAVIPRLSCSPSFSSCTRLAPLLSPTPKPPQVFKPSVCMYACVCVCVWGSSQQVGESGGHAGEDGAADAKRRHVKCI